MTVGFAALRQDVGDPLRQRVADGIQCGAVQQRQAVFIGNGVQLVGHFLGIAGIGVIAGVQSGVAVADAGQNHTVRVIAVIEVLPAHVGHSLRAVCQPLQAQHVRVIIGFAGVAVLMVENGRTQAEQVGGVGNGGKGQHQYQRRRQQQRAPQGLPPVMGLLAGGGHLNVSQHTLFGGGIGAHGVVSAINVLACHRRSPPKVNFSLFLARFRRLRTVAGATFSIRAMSAVG